MLQSDRITKTQTKLDISIFYLVSDRVDVAPADLELPIFKAGLELTDPPASVS